MNVLSMLEESPDGYLHFEDIASFISKEEALAQVRSLHALGLVDIFNVMWGLGQDADEIIEGATISLPGVLRLEC